MQVGIDYAREHCDFSVPEEALVKTVRAETPAAVPDPAEAMRQALEEPLRFPSVRRALTPDDHVTIVVDERVPHLVELLSALLEHLLSAGVTADAITLLCHTPSTGQPWLEQLPDEFLDVRIKVHDPAERRELSYLATTKGGRRIYLSRDAVDADQLIILTVLGYDPLLGYSCGEGALYPALSDEDTRKELLGQLSMDAPDPAARPILQEAGEVNWLLGAPIFIQVIEAAGDGIAEIVVGLADTSVDARERFEKRWRIVTPYPAELVIASLSGDPARHDFDALARALACAARVVKPRGRIALLSRAEPSLGVGADVILQSEEAEIALKVLSKLQPADLSAAYQWAWSVQQSSSVYLLSGLAEETAEELFTTPIQKAEQVQRLIDAAGSCLFLPDAQKSIAVVAE